MSNHTNSRLSWTSSLAKTSSLVIYPPENVKSQGRSYTTKHARRHQICERV